MSSFCETVTLVKRWLLKIGMVEADLHSLTKCDVSAKGCKSHKCQNMELLMHMSKNERGSHSETSVGCHNEKEVIMQPCGNKSVTSPAIPLTKSKAKRVNKRSISPFALRSGDRKSLHRKEKLKKSPNSKTGPFRHRRRSLSSLDTKNRNNGKVFGGDLDHLPLFSAQLGDGAMAYIPEFIIDAGKIILQNLSIEGIFRKAGSAQRQSELKRLLNIGKDLPVTVHPVDAACLLKQFLGSLSMPLIPSNIFSLMVRCLELTEENQLDALILCSLLLEKKRQDTLCYILEMLGKVAAHHQRNFMDASNLSIVMAPNILPQVLGKGKHERLCEVDLKLSSAILIIKILIEGANKVCRLPKSFEQLLACQSSQQEGLCHVESNTKHKKRRSGPITKFVIGLRRVVQGELSSSSNSSTEDVRIAPYDGSTPSSSHQLSSKDINISKENFNKENRKKCLSSACDSDQHPNKRLRVEQVSPSEEIPIPIRRPLLPSQPKKSSSLFSLKDGRKSPFKSSHTPLIKKPFQLPQMKTFTNMDLQAEENIHLGSASSWPFTSANIVLPKMQPSPNLLVVPCKKPRRRSCEPYLHYKNTTEECCSTPCLPKRKSDTFRKLSCPDGSSGSMLGPRGVPDGAECSIRDRATIKIASPRIHLRDMEEHYCEVKLAVKHLEDQVDQDNLQKMNSTLFPEVEAPHLKSISVSEMISKAYESVKLETENLDDINPSENMSRRLDKELKIRGRRSDEYKVSRSPSERKIGIVRRRSKELKEKCVQLSSHDLPMTPKMKSPLLQTPRHTLLKPGTPHSSRFVTGPLKPLMLGIPITDEFLSNKIPDILGGGHHNTAPLTRQRSAILGQRPLPTCNISSDLFNDELQSSNNSSQMPIMNNMLTHFSFEGNICSNLIDSETNVHTELGKGFSSKACDWTAAPNYMKKLDQQSNSNWLIPQVSLQGHRSSIAALRRQKKVSANVELFNKMKSSPMQSWRRRP